MRSAWRCAHRRWREREDIHIRSTRCRRRLAAGDRELVRLRGSLAYGRSNAVGRLTSGLQRRDGKLDPTKARCVKGRADAAAFWVGIGGFNEDSSTLQQVGTTAQCSSRGVATYFVWWEIVPAAEVRVPMKVTAGDRVTAAVLISGSKVTMSIKNTTRRTRFSTTVTVAQPLDVSSAEWIAEAPTACAPSGACEVVPLTNFGSVTFGKAAATANRVSGTITNSAWLATPLQLIPAVAAAGFGAAPGALSPDGRSFRVSSQRVASAQAVGSAP